MSQPKIGIALSGGGYRASVFGLGVLLYLVDAGKNGHVASISSVSGGSFTNGFVAQAGPFGEYDGVGFREAVRPFVHAVAHQTAWSTPVVWLYLVVLIGSLLGIVGAIWWADFPTWVGFALFLAFLLPWGWLLRQRGVLAGRAFASKFFSPTGRPTRLDEIDDSLDHVICSTHLNAGEHFYFSSKWVYSWRFGWGVPGKLPLHVAVQASAAFPGGFPPRWLRTARFHFEGGKGRPGPLPKSVTLTDGGVYDNMADEWPSRVASRAKKRPELHLRVPEELIVVNSSAGLAWSSVKRLALPLVGELLALLRDVDVMYDNSASQRMQALVRRFDSGEWLRGSLVTIEQSPFKVPDYFAEHGTSEQKARAEAVLDRLDDREEWRRITETDAQVPTTLSKLGPAVTGRLLRHGYATAMANLHVILDYPLLEVPDVAAFVSLAE